ncbi:L10-interacting MYB domain-containing protein-like [Quercus lobata]|uniref:L10-interacting MYB domain-containing protein-like n=1 Tax=Quercus lobata TaxID=97700 RepID=UPI001243AE08|nr:L10-interacting MYB domain-containing protein-like [Quercus lobata]
MGRKKASRSANSPFSNQSFPWMRKNTTFKSEAKKGRALWGDSSWTTTFCNLCVEQIEAENRTKGAAFSPKVWTILVTKFCDETGLNYDKDQLKSRWNVLKVDWRVWEQLKSHDTGLSWNAVKGTIDASDDWWDRKLKDIPKATKFQ